MWHDRQASMGVKTTMKAADLFDLTGRVALVTGASSGLGMRFAELLAANGAAVALVARRAERLAATRARIEAAGGRAIAIEADNRDYEDAEAIEGPKAHHAVNHNNNSGHGSGAYASPDAVKAYQAWLKDALDQVNAKWLDKHTGRDGEIAEGVKELVTTYQVGGHLYKHGRDHGKFTAPDEPRGVQRDKFTAIWFGRERAAVEKEARRYCWSIWQEKLKQLEPQPEDEPQQHPDDAIDVQPDADDWASHEEAMAREQEEEIARAR